MRKLSFLLLFSAAVPAGDNDLEARVEATCADLTKALEAYLGPRFKGPVPVKLVTSKFFADFMNETTKKLVPAGLFEIAQELGVRLKQFPPDFDLLAAQTKMIETAVAGLYDPDKDCFYVAEKMGQPENPLFKITATHELVHAYRDVDKDYWPRTVALVTEDMDWAGGVRFLVEGDASLVGFGVGRAALRGSDPERAMKTVAQTAPQMAQMIFAGMEAQLKDFPLVLRETLGAAYADGMVFAAAVYQAGGKEALERAYDQPPRSTEQVLHPEKFIGPEIDEPMVFTGGDPTAALGDGWTLALANVMGEFDVRLHFTERMGRDRAKAVAAGWDGARYFFCRKAGAPSFLGMITTWDTNEDAAEFADAWAEWSAQRDGQTREVFKGATDRLVLTNDGLVAVRALRNDVLVADGVPPNRVAAVFASLAGAQRRERKADDRPAAMGARKG